MTYKPHRDIRTSKRVGDPSSKYGYNPAQLDIDVARNREETEKYKKELKELITRDPTRIKNRYYIAIDVLLEIKREFNI